MNKNFLVAENRIIAVVRVEREQSRTRGMAGEERRGRAREEAGNGETGNNI